MRRIFYIDSVLVDKSFLIIKYTVQCTNGYVLLLGVHFTALQRHLPSIEIGVVLLARMITVVQFDGRLLRGDANQVVTELAQNVAHRQYGQHVRVVQEAEFGENRQHGDYLYASLMF